MPAEWSTFFAVLILFFTLAYFFYRASRRSRNPRERELNTTSAQVPLIVHNAEWEMLTSRQKEVARLAGRGLSNDEIAQQLDIKTNTVDAHLKKIYATLKVHSRTELSYKIRKYLD